MFCLLFTLGAALLASQPEHRLPPAPNGLVFRLTVREVDSRWDKITVRAANVGSPGIVVSVPGTSESISSRALYGYPSGALLATDPIDEAEGAGVDPWFDFDGDGTADAVQIGSGADEGLVEVISGASGAVLFAQRDPLEYETSERAFPLGDLDGDGFGELALVHPRMNRSAYDPELWDWLLGAKSWVTVVSGSRIAWR